MGNLRAAPTDSELRELDLFLDTSEPQAGMPLEAVDGLLAGVACGPHLVPPSVWLPAIWRGEMPEFESEAEAERIVDTLLRLHNSVRDQLDQGTYGPLVGRLTDDDESPLAALSDWCRGFVVGTNLQGGIWLETIQSDRKFAELLAPITIVSASGDESPERSYDREALDTIMGELIDSVFALRDYWREHDPEAAGGSRMTAGRNDPCPCGSGKKFKKCCGSLVQPLSVTILPSGSEGRETRLRAAQLERLCQADWLDPRGPIRLAGDMTPDEVTGAGHYQNTRIFLAELISQKGTPATEKKNLNRRFVADMLPKLQVESKYREDIYEFNKVINEHDVWLLHIVRVLCDLAKLVRVYRKRFIATPAGRRLLEPGCEGELYRLLFVTHFRTLNLAYIGFRAKLPEVQFTLAVTLYRISQLCDDWCEIDKDLADAVFLPAVIHRIAEHATPYGDHRDFVLSMRVLNPLERFGLLEFGYQVKDGRKKKERVRKTRLFNRFLDFQV